MNGFRTIDDLDVSGKVVLVRGDLNVPTNDAGEVTDTNRLDRFAPTLKDLAARGARIAVLSHFGRPKGERVAKYSLKPVAEALARSLGQPVAFADDCVGDAARSVIAALNPGDVAVLENVRFHPGEEKNDPAFARDLAALGDIYINDAFSAAHRAHASTEGIAHILPSAAGRFMQEELTALTKALEHPERPVAAVVGGAKISTKLELLGNLVARVDCLILGGGMANTFLYASGTDIGGSLCEKDMADSARAIMDKARASGCTVFLPEDAVIAREFKAGAPSEVVAVNAIPADAMMLDVGPATVETLKTRLAACKTVVWNGPLGAFEIEPFDAGTTAIARFVAERTKAGQVLSVAGGGDTVAALATAGVGDAFSYVSAAGGAFLEWLEGKELPGVTALRAGNS